MRLLIPIAIVAFVLATPTSSAQVPECSSYEPYSNAIYQGTFQVSVSLPIREQIEMRATKACDVVSQVCVWLNGNGHTDYTINTLSIRFEGDSAGIVDDLRTYEIFSLLAHRTVSKGVELGYSYCIESCSQEQTRVYTNTYVQRSDTDSTTQFFPCDSDLYSWRSYAICCTDNLEAPMVKDLKSEIVGYDQVTACEATCEHRNEPLTIGEELH